MVSKFQGKWKVCRKVVVLAVYIVNHVVGSSVGGLSRDVIFVEIPAGVAVNGAKASLETDIVTEIVSIEIVQAHSGTPIGIFFHMAVSLVLEICVHDG